MVLIGSRVAAIHISHMLTRSVRRGCLLVLVGTSSWMVLALDSRWKRTGAVGDFDSVRCA